MNVKMKLAATVVSLFAAGGAWLTTAAPASASTMLGGVNVAQYCSATAAANGALTSNATTVNNTSGGWRCSDRKWSGSYWYTSLRGVDMNRACALQYKFGAWSGNPTNTLYGWRCYR